jgi:hypothetical protein
LTLLLLGACTSVVYSAADLQVDVAAELPADAAVVRVCVAGQGVHEEGAGNGRVAVPAIRADEVAVVVIQVDDTEGTILETAPVELDLERPYALADANVAPAGPCTTAGDWARDDADWWLLVARFDEPNR